MYGIENSCSFTGHRSITARDLPERLERRLNAAVFGGYMRYLCGMARGFDMLAASAVLKLRRENPRLRLECILPCEGQNSRWPRDEMMEYERILGEADNVFYTARAYDAECMARRNRFLVMNSSLIIAYYDGRESGGTFQTVNYANEAGVRLLYV